MIPVARLTVIAALVFMALQPAHAEDAKTVCAGKYSTKSDFDRCMRNWVGNYSLNTGRPEIDDYQTWTTNPQNCQIMKHFRPGDNRLVIERGTRIHIDVEEIADLEKAIHNLKICSKFYECVAQRDGIKPPPKGQKRPQHCYESMWSGWKAIP
jgi:hypothetical protein